MGKAFGIFIGINEYKDAKYLLDLHYAEKDCRDLRTALCTYSNGWFTQENTLQITGTDATTDRIEAALYKHVVRGCEPDDTVLIYFSGHGFIATDESIPYLASYDVDVMQLTDNPNKGLRMERLYSEYFKKSPARQVLLILDCCHSGAFSSGGNTEHAQGEERGQLVRPSMVGGRGRMALVSCPPEEQSRESVELQNGMFTHYLVRGLQGEAVDPGTSEVTVDSLLAYAKRSMPQTQVPGSVGELYGRLVLTTPGVGRVRPASEAPRALRVEENEEGISLITLGNPIEKYTAVIQTLISQITTDAGHEYADVRILQAILSTGEAHTVAVVRETAGEFTLLRRHTAQQDAAAARRASRCVNRAVTTIAQMLRSREDHHNTSLRMHEDEGGSWVTIGWVPDHTGRGREFVIIAGDAPNTLASEDVFVQLAVAIYLSTNRLTEIRAAVLESLVLDYMRKRFYHHVPIGWYRRRFELFRNRLRDVIMYFQPVLCLQPRSLYISAWEALARDRESKTTPVDIFAAAEIWGTRFVTELDLYCVRSACDAYMEALRVARMQRPNEIPDLCVNLYPSTILRTAFRKVIEQVIQDHPALQRRIILEISEKLPLPEEASDLRMYKQRLESFVRDYGLTFAIDDFGVGYSSVERLAHLCPSYVKIDREVLHLQTGDHAIRYVLDVTSSQRLSPAKVVVEGFDGDSDISLARLYQLGVRYVQGFTIGKAGPALYRIEREDARLIEALLVERRAG